MGIRLPCRLVVFISSTHPSANRRFSYRTVKTRNQALLGELTSFISPQTLSLFFTNYSLFMNFSFSIAPLNNRSTALHSWLVGGREKGDLRVANCRQQWQPENEQDATYPPGHRCQAQNLSFKLILTKSETAGFQGGHVQQQRRQQLRYSRHGTRQGQKSARSS